MITIDAEAFIRVTPESKDDIRRIKFLNEEAKEMRIAVFGLFNHGKSTLLNTLIGKEVFKTSDKRETTKIQTHQHENIIWVDAPGLKADSTGSDDREAMNALKQADVVFWVHSLDTGELDKAEYSYYLDFKKQANYNQRVFLILTQMDQVELENRPKVVSTIKEKLPELTTLTVSATIYSQGIRENKRTLVEYSGMEELFKLVSRLAKDIGHLRDVEISTLANKIQIALERKRTSITRELFTAQDCVTDKKATFKAEVGTYLHNVQMKM